MRAELSWMRNMKVSNQFLIQSSKCQNLNVSEYESVRSGEYQNLLKPEVVRI